MHRTSPLPAAHLPPPLAACRATFAKDGPPPIPYESLYEMFSASVKKYPDNRCLGHREGEGYSWLTYSETGERVAAIGSALVKAGLQPHGRVGVYGANSPEWMIAMQVRHTKLLLQVLIVAPHDASTPRVPLDSGRNP